MLEEMILRDDEAELGSISCKVIGLIRELLVGGFKFLFIFIPIWGNDPIGRAYFSNGLKPPTRLYNMMWSLEKYVEVQLRPKFRCVQRCIIRLPL